MRIQNKTGTTFITPRRLSAAEAFRLIELHWQCQRAHGTMLSRFAVHAVYECLLMQCKRYEGHVLAPLERFETSNCKTGIVGDVNVMFDNRTVEAVEISFGTVTRTHHVAAAIEKIKSANVRRYYVLGTGGIQADERQAIREQIAGFFRSNGCEIIVNGILESLRYYLRMLGSVDEFISRYVDHLANDNDLSYEHRTAWNDVCEAATTL